MKLRIIAIVTAGLIAAAASSAAATCESLGTLSLPHTSITAAESRPAGDFTLPGGRKLPLPAYCRVAGVSKPSADSDIRFEVWMPSSGWNGKFQGIGNGGYAGAIGFAGLADAVARGYATASTDTGHTESAGVTAAWALHHPEKIVDFGHRAIHETAVNAKAIIRAFYGEGPKLSYFNSCSNGGRQALMEAQRYPADYDGIISGAPANNWTRLLSFAAANAKSTLADPASYIPASKLPAIQAAALAACDANDGVKDGVIENPAACRFDPSVLLCEGAASDSCLTQPQLTALRGLYGGLKDSKGKLLFPGYSQGGEAEAGGWGPWITGDAPAKSLLFAFGTQFFKNMVFDNPDWDFRSFDAERDVKAAERKFANVLNSTNPDLSAFRKRGGKLIMYHGWSDAAIPALSAIDYYQSAVAKAGAKEAEAFLRLYMVPGMQHCGGGSGPNTFGQAGVAKGDPLHDVDAALEAWVEKGTAPDRIIATKFRAASAAPGETERTRPLCRYPQVARWNGTGSTDDAANFVCAEASAR